MGNRPAGPQLNRPGEVWLTAAEVAAELRVHRQTVYRLVDSGELRAAKFRGSVRINERDLARYVREARTFDYEDGGAAR